MLGRLWAFVATSSRGGNRVIASLLLRLLSGWQRPLVDDRTDHLIQMEALWCPRYVQRLVGPAPVKRVVEAGTACARAGAAIADLTARLTSTRAHSAKTPARLGRSCGFRYKQALRLISIPAIIVFSLGQKHIMKGLRDGAVEGQRGRVLWRVNAFHFRETAMPTISRRSFSIAAALTALAPPTRGMAQAKPIKLLLNTSFSGPVSFLLLAEDKGYLREAGLDVAFSPGDGAAAIVPKVRQPDFDAGYGDITALIQRIAMSPPDQGPVAIWTTFNSVPFTIAVPASGPVQVPKDFEGRSISGDAHDAALLTFDMFAKATGIDRSKVKVMPTNKAMGQQVVDMLNGKGADGAFGFVNTIVASVAPLGVDGRKELRFLTYADYLPDMYGNGLFVTRELYADKSSLSGLVRAFNRALADAIANPDVAIDALAKRNPSVARDINRTRLVGTFGAEMAHPEGARLGIGDMDDERLARLIDLVVAAKNLPRKPGIREVFDRSFLPPDAERIRSLARRT